MSLSIDDLDNRQDDVSVVDGGGVDDDDY